MLSASVGLPGYVGALAVITSGYALFQAANNTAVMTKAVRDKCAPFGEIFDRRAALIGRNKFR